VAIRGLGTDLARIARFRKFITPDNPVLLRIFTETERVYCLEKRDPAPHLAARFAAKEAFLKALGTGLRDGLAWQQIEVERDELGCPYLRLNGRAAEYLQLRSAYRVHLNYSHDGDYAVATVILED
jgi:holo-[acyl-carrier protein] synthase